jgi:predicted dehydrogenase
MSTLTRRDFHSLAGAAIFSLAFPNTGRAHSPERKRIRIGQIGTTHSHAAGKMEALRKLDHVFEVVGIVEPDRFIRENIQTQAAYRGLRWMTERELFAVPELDAVAVETDLNELVPTAARCIEAGKHVHLDKPPGRSLTDFEDLLKSASENRLLVQMGYMFRYNPAFQFCLRAVRKGLIGEIFEVDGVISKVVNPERRSGLAATYRGSMMLLGCHLVDMLIAICGKPGCVTAYRRRTYPEKDALYDNELAVFEYDRATAVIRSTLVEVEGKERRQFVVCGTRGTIEIKPLEPSALKLALDRDVGGYRKGCQKISLPGMQGRYDAQVLDFARMIRGEKKPDFSPAHDLAVHAALLQASGM